MEGFLAPMGVSHVGLAKHVGAPVQRINEVARGSQSITPATAWLLSQAFRTTPTLWMNLQTNHDLAVSRPKEFNIRLLRSAP